MSGASSLKKRTSRSPTPKRLVAASVSGTSEGNFTTSVRGAFTDLPAYVTVARAIRVVNPSPMPIRSNSTDFTRPSSR